MSDKHLFYGIRHRVPFIISSLILTISLGLFLLPLAGCAQETASQETGDAVKGEDVYSIQVYLNDTLKESLTLNDLLSLEQVVLTTPEQDSDQHGPTLPSVLKAAGIESFSELTVIGLSKGRVATAELTLSSNQVDETVVLDITNRGTTKLAGINIPSEDWIRDVSELRVK
jgi:hypothetical protein